MRKSIRFLSLGLVLGLAVRLMAGDPPMIQVDLPDIAATMRRMESGLPARIWNDPTMAPWRKEAERAIHYMNSAMEFDGFSPLRMARAAQIRVDRFGTTAAQVPDVGGHAWLIHGATVAAMWAPIGRLLKRDGTQIAINGLLTAYDLPCQPIPVILGRSEDALLALVGGANMPTRTRNPAGADDLVIRLGDLAGLIRGFIELDQAASLRRLRWMNPEQQQHGDIAARQQHRTRALLARLDELRRAATDAFAPITLAVRVMPDGFRERWSQVARGPASGKGADRALIRRLPDSTLMVVAAHVDGGAFWQDYGPALLQVPGMFDQAFVVRTPEQIAAMIDAELAELGVMHGLAHLLGSVRGTIVVALTHDAPSPAVTVAVPRSAALDQALSVLLQRSGYPPLPPAGQARSLTIPGFPLPMAVGGDAGHLLVSSDPAIVDRWISGTTGTLLDSVAAKRAAAYAPADATLFGFSDTPAVLRVLSGGIPMIGWPELAEPGIQRLVMRLAEVVATGWVWGGISGGERVLETQNCSAWSTGCASTLLWQAAIRIMPWQSYGRAPPPR